MSELDKVIDKHRKNSMKLKEIYLGQKELNYEKGLELRKQQDEEYKKMIFLKNLRREIEKNGRN